MKRFVVGSGALAFAFLLIGALLEPLMEPPSGGVDLRTAVAANMTASGVEHPVTAVLLNFRGYDTLLEIAVLLLPPLITAIITLAAGMLAESPGSPLVWAKLIAEREYRQGVTLP